MITHSPPAQATTLRIGSVSYLNAKPLIYGLDQMEDLALHLAVPSELLAGLRADLFDAALLPVIDYQRFDGLVLVPSGEIGCDGPTLTVRLFSRVPIERIGALHCDSDSHTSVALARIILGERYGIRPDFLDFAASAATQSPEACLLIGDKVVCQEPSGYRHQLDLGAAWKDLTGLPFVFAVWTARAGVDLRDLPQRLAAARCEGLRHVDEIVARHAVPRGWPAEVARQYLTDYLRFDIGPRQFDAVRRFHELAEAYGLIAPPLRTLAIYR